MARAREDTATPATWATLFSEAWGFTAAREARTAREAAEARMVCMIPCLGMECGARPPEMEIWKDTAIVWLAHSALTC